MVTQETSPSGQPNSNSEQFQYSVGASLFRVTSGFPMKPGSLNLKALQNPLLTTYEDGKFTNNLSACVSAVQYLQEGTYVIVPSTFKP
mmetsp:Transcript_9346/g.14133  ORF Transcript_9346/g.14133 Transcript_9346/m.14133 type:complete len:88 (+) Transcript_9346:2696-2959(+)